LIHEKDIAPSELLKIIRTKEKVISEMKKKGENDLSLISSLN
jgi:hypothetical protein